MRVNTAPKMAAAAAASPSSSQPPAARPKPLLERPIVDPSWTRVPDDHFHPTRPSTSATPLHPLSEGPQHGGTAAAAATNGNEDDVGAESDGGSSEWSYTEETELVTLDLGTERMARKALLGLAGGSIVEPKSSATIKGLARGQKVDGPQSAYPPKTGKGRGKTTAGRDGEIGEPATAASAAATASSGTAQSRSVLGAGRMFSLTGLDTTTPLLKVGNTILRGKRTELIGSEIILKDEYNPSRPLGQQHVLRPLPPSETSSSPASSSSYAEQQHVRPEQPRHPTTKSSTSSARLSFVPIYDPTDNERLPADVRKGMLPPDLAALAAQSGASGSGARATPARVKGKAKGKEKAAEATPAGEEISDDDDDVPLAQLQEASAAVPVTPAPPKRRGRLPLSELPEEEQLFRKAERSVRKEYNRREKAARKAAEQQQQAGESAAGGDAAAGQGEASSSNETGMEQAAMTATTTNEGQPAGEARSAAEGEADGDAMEED